MLSASCSLAMSGYRTWRLSYKMPTADCLCRTRSSKLNYRQSRSGWIKREVRREKVLLFSFSTLCVCSTKSCGSITIDFRTYREAIARGRRFPTTIHRSYIEHYIGRCQSPVKDPERGRRVSTLHFDHVTSALTGTNSLVAWIRCRGYIRSGKSDRNCE